MLIICPECGKEISDKAPHCIHCGYPIQSVSLEKLDSQNNSQWYDVKLIACGESKVMAIKIIRECTGFSLSQAKPIADNLSYIKTNISLDEANKIKNEIEKIGGKVSVTKASGKSEACNIDSSQPPKINPNQVKCPFCGSPDVRKITQFNRAMGSLFFGFNSPNHGKQWNCRNCDSFF